MGGNGNEYQKTIGVLINSIDGYYQSPIWKGIKKAAEERNVHLLFFAGASLKSTVLEEKQQNAIFQLVNSHKMDGIILSTGSLINYVGIDNYEKFIQELGSIPMVSISVQMDDIPSVVIDNRESMHLLVNHLIEHHHFSRIAFIKGTNVNPEAIMRFQGYKDALREYGIPYDDNLIIEGNFHDITTPDGIKKLISDEAHCPEVVVASNDEMALISYFELKNLGFKVGKDIGLAGFDDIEEATSFFPSLTTIRQPIYEMAYKATEILCDALEGKPVPMLTYLSGTLMVRESCGCFNEVHSPFVYQSSSDCTPVSANYDENLELLKRSITNRKLDIYGALAITLHQTNAPEDLFPVFFDELFSALITDLKNRTVSGVFLRTLNDFIGDCLVVRKCNLHWNEMLELMKSFMMDYAADPIFAQKIQEIFHTAIVLHERIQQKAVSQKFSSFKRMYVGTRMILQKFNTALDEETMISVILKALPLYGIHNCFMCLFEEPIRNRKNRPFVLPEKTRLILAYQHGVCGIEKLFNTEDMLPDEYLYHKGQSELIFYPLVVLDEFFGYIALDLNGVNEFIYESFREQISNTLKLQQLFRERIRAEEKLNSAIRDLEKLNSELKSIYLIDELTGLYNRHGFNLHGSSLFKSAMITGGKLILCFCDMDGMKVINDSFGHSEGDAALKMMAQILSSSFEKEDIVARLGGDEFTIIVPNKSSRFEMDAISDRIQSNLADYNNKSGKPYKLSISTGFCSYNSGVSLTFEDLLMEADKQLYQQKKQKKQCRI